MSETRSNVFVKRALCIKTLGRQHLDNIFHAFLQLIRHRKSLRTVPTLGERQIAMRDVLQKSIENAAEVLAP